MKNRDAPKIVVTRQPGIYKYLIEKGYVPKDTPHVAFAKVEDVQDKHAFGLLPTWLACHTALYSEVQIKVPIELRGKELPYDNIEFYINDIRTYTIKEEK